MIVGYIELNSVLKIHLDYLLFTLFNVATRNFINTYVVCIVFLLASAALESLCLRLEIGLQGGVFRLNVKRQPKLV